VIAAMLLRKVRGEDDDARNFLARWLMRTTDVSFARRSIGPNSPRTDDRVNHQRR
jgi:hypothetical protein